MPILSQVKSNTLYNEDEVQYINHDKTKDMNINKIAGFMNIAKHGENHVSVLLIL